MADSLSAMKMYSSMSSAVCALAKRLSICRCAGNRIEFSRPAAPERLVSFGEIGLAGEIRPVRFGTERIAAAAKQGFTKAIVPVGNVPKRAPKGIEVIGVRRLADALDAAW